MVAKIAGMDATSNKACAIGAARMVGVVDKVGMEMDVMAHLEDMDTTFVCLRLASEMVSNQLCYCDFFTKKIPKINVDYCCFIWLLQKVHNSFDSMYYI